MKRHLSRFLIIWLILMVLLGIFLYIRQAEVTDGTSAERPKDFVQNIPRITSSVDRDSDGIDDQTDILENALSYVATKPTYQSNYYPSGYPDDGYGVCTDVVAFALKGAGYDLRESVDEDIHAHPEDYDITEPDDCIDFRRVKNLLVYFTHTAMHLPTDLSSPEDWQGGDIVVFKKHIGIISDRRNKRGIPYVIHHNDPYQKNYEQDILEKRSDIVGHFRVSQ